MRRGLAGLVLGLSLILASVAWAGFTMSRTVLDPGRSERLAEQLFENEQLRAALVSRVAAGLKTALPDGAPAVPDQLLESAADRALDDEGVQTLVRDGIVRTHRNALEGNVEPVTIDAAALGAAARAALVETRPELDAVLPAVPEVAVTLPTSGLSRLGAVKNFVDRFTMLAAVVALLGAVVSLIVTSDRPAVLRRVAGWAFGAAGFWLVIGFGIPWIANRIAPTSAAIVAAIIDVFFGAMIPPAIVMAFVGAALFGASMLWGTMSSRAGAVAMQGRGRQNAARTAADPAMEQGRPTGGVMSNVRGPSAPSPQPRRSPTADQTQVQPRPTQTGQLGGPPAGAGHRSPGQTDAANPNVGQPTNQPGAHPTGSAARQSTPSATDGMGGGPTGATPGAALPHAGQHQSSGAGQPGVDDTVDDLWALTAPQQRVDPKPAKVWVEGVGYVDPDDPRISGN